MGPMQKAAISGFQVVLFIISVFTVFIRCDYVTKSSRKIYIGIVIGGCISLLCSIIYFAIMSLRLRRKASALREIQGALAKQKVHPPFYTYAELRAATKNFSSNNSLGEGANGVVYRGKLGDGTVVAVKKLFKDRQVLAEFLNEAVLITGIKHRNLVQLKGCCIQHDQRILVYEYAENGNLADALWGNAATKKKVQHRIEAALSWQKRLNICIGLARGLSYLHEELLPRIIHRDIKPANILMDAGFNAKIADFGLARAFLDEQTGVDYTHVAGTFGYLAPEYVSQGQLTEKADVFSFGIVLLEIVSGRKCINNSLPHEKASLVHWVENLRKKGNLLDILDPTAQGSSNHEEVLRVVDIAFSCLHADPALRPSMSQALLRLQGNARAAAKQVPNFISLSGSQMEESTQLGVRAAHGISMGSND